MIKSFARKLLSLIFIAAGVVAAQTVPLPPPVAVPVTPIRTTRATWKLKVKRYSINLNPWMK